MFIRFKRDDLWYPHARRAVLVESHRVNGKPRQRVICYLGSIDDRQMRKPYVRWRFMEHANDAIRQAYLNGKLLTGDDMRAARRKLTEALDELQRSEGGA